TRRSPSSSRTGSRFTSPRRPTRRRGRTIRPRASRKGRGDRRGPGRYVASPHEPYAAGTPLVRDHLYDHSIAGRGGAQGRSRQVPLEPRRSVSVRRGLDEGQGRAGEARAGDGEVQGPPRQVVEGPARGAGD